MDKIFFNLRRASPLAEILGRNSFAWVPRDGKLDLVEALKISLRFHGVGIGEGKVGPSGIIEPVASGAGLGPLRNAWDALHRAPVTEQTRIIVFKYEDGGLEWKWSIDFVTSKVEQVPTVYRRGGK